jgi:hypothetical protein
VAATTEQSNQDMEPYRLAPHQREQARQRVFEQITQAWELADIAGLRRSSWAAGANRYEVLAQRIRALDDRRLFALWDGHPPRDYQQGPTEVADVFYEAIACSHLALRVPEHLLATPPARVFGR